MESLEELKAELRQVLSGEIEASEAGLGSELIRFNTMPDVSLRALKAEHYRLSLLAAVARNVELGTLDQTAKVCLDYISVLAKKFHNNQLSPALVSGIDIAEGTLALIDEAEKSNIIKRVGSGGIPGSNTQDGRFTAIPVECGREGEGVDDPEIEERKNDSEEISAIPVDCGREGEGLDDPEIEERNNGSADVSAGVVYSGREQEAPKVRKTKTKQTKETVKKEKPRHYSERKCPLKVFTLPRHIRLVHVEKNERIPLSRVKAIVEMTRHGDKIRGGKYTKVSKDGQQRQYKRDKYKCHRCDSVVLCLSTRFQRVHNLVKGAEDYEHTMLRSRRCKRKAVEFMCDESYIKRKRKQASEQPSTSKRSKSDSDEENEEQTKKLTPLQLLSQELSSDTSDEDYEACPMPSVLPGTPRKTKQSFSTSQKETASVTPVDKEGPSQEATEGNVDDRVDSQHDEGAGRDDETSDESTSESSSDEGSSGEDYEESETSESEANTATRQQTWKQFYREGHAKSLKDTLLVKFCKHLQDILGGCKKESLAIEHAQNVRRVWDMINPDHDTLTSLLDDGGLNIWRKWAKPLLDSKKVRPGTIRASLTSLNKFFEFIVDQTDNKIKGFPGINSSTIEAIKRVIKRVVAMCSSVNQLFCHEQWERVLEEVMNAVDPSDVNAMVDTEPAKKALSLLIRSMSEKISQDEAVVVRDCLIAQDEAAKRSAHTLMCHTSRTAEKHYMINKVSEAAVEGHRVLAENMGLKETEATVIPASKSPVAENEDIEADDENEEALSQPNFTDEQRDDIDLMFSHVIKTNGPLSMEQTRAFMSESLNLISFVNDPVMVTKVYKRVKYLQGLQMKQGLESLEAVDSKSKTSEWLNLSSETSSKQRRRFLWAQEDEQVIMKEFMAFQTCPVKAVILDCFRSTPSLKEIAERNGLLRCYEKVKNIFKKRSS